MVGKNNKKLLTKKNANHVNIYAIKKFKFGVASVTIGGLLFLINATHADAAEVTATDNTAIAAPETTVVAPQNETSDSATPQAETAETNDTLVQPHTRTKRAAADTVKTENVEQQPELNNKVGYGNNPENGIFEDISTTFGNVDFTGATNKSEVIADQLSDTNISKVEGGGSAQHLGAITLNWKEKKVSEINGWHVVGGDGTVNVIKPEAPTNVAENRPAEFPPIATKSYTNNGTMNKTWPQSDTANGNGAFYTTAVATPDVLAKAPNAKPDYYIELGKKGTVLEKEYAVNGNSQIGLRITHGGAYGNAGLSSRGERFKFTVVDADTNRAILTSVKIKDQFKQQGGESFVIAGPASSVSTGDSGWAQTSRFYDIPEGVSKVKVKIEAYDNGEAHATEVLQDGFLLGGVEMAVAPAIDIKTNMVSKKKSNEYGPENLYKKDQTGEFKASLKNVGGMKLDGPLTFTVVVPEGVELTEDAKKGNWAFGPYVSPSNVHFDESTRILTFKTNSVNGSVDKLPPLTDKTLDIKVPFVTKDDFTGSATFKLSVQYQPSTKDALGNEVFQPGGSGSQWRYKVDTGSLEFSDDPSYKYERTIYIDTKVPKAPTLEPLHTDKITGDSTAKNQTEGLLLTLPTQSTDNSPVDTTIISTNDPNIQANSKLDKAEITFPNNQKVTLIKKEDGWYNGDQKIEEKEGKLVVPIPAGVDLTESTNAITAKVFDKAGNESEEAQTNIVNEAPQVEVAHPETKHYPRSNNITDEQILAMGGVTATDLEDDRDASEATNPTKVIVNRNDYDAAVPGEYTITVKSVDSENKESDIKSFKIKVLPLIPVAPDNPQTEGTPIVDPNYPDNPAKPKWPAGVDKDSLNKDVIRTITYVKSEDGTETAIGEQAPEVTQKASFTRRALVNPETGEVLYIGPNNSTVDSPNDAWQPANANLPQVNSPIVTGYITTTASVAPKEVTALTDNSTEKVVYTKLGKFVPVVPEGIEKPENSDVTYPNNPTDPTQATPDTAVIPYIEGTVPTFNGEPLNPINSEDPKQGYRPPAVTNVTQDTPIEYIKTTQEATITFIDTAKPNEPLATIGETGNSGTEIPRENYENKLKELKKLGYEINPNIPNADAFSTPQNFDTDTSVNQNFVVQLVEKILPINPDKPLTPGQPIDPSNPDGPKWTPEKIKEITDNNNKVLSRTISYVDNKGNKVDEPFTDTATFNRVANINMVTGEITYDNWTSTDATIDGKVSPVKEGFVANKAEVTAIPDLTADSEKPQDVIVVYTPVGKFVTVVPEGIKKPENSDVTYPNNPDDATKVITDQVVIPHIPGTTPQDKDGNPLTLVDPQDPTQGYHSPTVTDPTKDTPINYIKDEQQAVITFVEGTTPIANITETGQSGKEIPRNNYETKLEELKKQGYKVITDEFSTSQNFDNDKTTPQNFVVTIEAPSITIEPNQPLEPGQPIDPSNPDGPKWTPEKIKEITDNNNKVLSRTISYVDNKGNKVDEPFTDTATFSRVAHINVVTGEITYDGWTSTDTTIDGKVSPVKEGFVANKAEVAAISNLTADSEKPQDVEVIYTPVSKFVPVVPEGIDPVDPIVYPNNPNNPTEVITDEIVIPYIPGTTPVGPDGKALTPKNPDNPNEGYLPPVITDPKDNTPIVYVKDNQDVKITFVEQGKDGQPDKVVTIITETGQSGKEIPRNNYETKLEELKKQGYKVITDEFSTSQNFDNDKTTPQNFVVTIEAPSITIEPNQPLEPGQPIDPSNPDGPKWTPEKIKEITDNNNKVLSRTISYIDNKGNKVDEPFTDTATFSRVAHINVVTGEITYDSWTSTDTTIDGKVSPVKEGFVANTAEVAAISDLTADSEKPQDVEVIYTPVGKFVPVVPEGIDPVDPIVYPNNPNNPTEVITDEIVIPYIPGTTPVGPDGKELTPKNPDNPSEGYLPPVVTDPKDNTPIVYVKDNQDVKITFVEQGKDGQPDKVVSIITESGQSGKEIPRNNYETKLEELKKQGYKVVTDEFNTSQNFDNDKTTPQNFVVTIEAPSITIEPNQPLEPGQPIDPSNPDGPKWTPEKIKEITDNNNKVLSRTISYVDNKGNKVDEPFTDTATFSRVAHINVVTGEITYDGWTSTDTTIDGKVSPVKEGLVANKAEVAAISNLTADSEKPQDVEVIYTPVGKFVPVVPEGIDPVDPIVYPNNPNNPTEVITDEIVIPYIPGTTPKDKDGNPLTPIDPQDVTKGYHPPIVPDHANNTIIIYVKDKQNQPENNDKPVEPSTPENNDKPVEPSTPENNDKPVEPSTPENNDKPVEPSKPGNNNQLVNPATSTSNNQKLVQAPLGKIVKELPDTGLNSVPTTAAGIGVLALLSIMGLRRRKNK